MSFLGKIVSAITTAIIGGINRWIQARKAAAEKARADALATREESEDRADKAEDSINAAAEEEKSKPEETSDEGKADALRNFGGTNDA